MIRVASGIVHVEGPLTMRTVAGVLATGRDAVLAGAREVDLSGVTELDSAALAMLFDWSRAAAAPLAMRNVPAGLQGLARLYGVEEMLGGVSAAS